MGKSVIKIELPRQMEITEALEARGILHAALDSYIAAHHTNTDESRWLRQLATLLRDGDYDHQLEK